MLRKSFATRTACAIRIEFEATHHFQFCLLTCCHLFYVKIALQVFIHLEVPMLLVAQKNYVNVNSPILETETSNFAPL